MDSNPALITAIVVAIGSVGGTVAAALLAYRSSRRTAEETRETAEDANEVAQTRITIESWAEQVKSWREDVVTLRKQRAEDLAAYEHAHEVSTGMIRDLSRKLDELASQHRQERADLESRIDAMAAWGRQVVGIMRGHGVSFPPPPPGIESGHTPREDP